jgi:predicted dehydrogenase
MPEQLRALVIGCGMIAGGYNEGPDDAMVLTHALAYRRHPDYVLAACVEPDEKARTAFVRKWSAPAGYETLEQALDAEQFDVVSICSPTGTHLPTLARLLAAPLKAVFAEKPLDGDAVGARRLGAQYAAKNVPVAVNFTRRFDPAMQALKAEIASGRHGRLRAVAGWYGRGVVNNGSHMLDLAAFLIGSAPRLESVDGIIDDGVAGDPTVTTTLDLDGIPFRLTGCDGRDFARFELELTFTRTIVALEEGALSIRRRPVQESSVIPGSRMAGQGSFQPSRYGEAMLRALDELKNWPQSRRLSSDIASASEAIALADEVRCAAQGTRAGRATLGKVSA